MGASYSTALLNNLSYTPQKVSNENYRPIYSIYIPKKPITVLFYRLRATFHEASTKKTFFPN